MATVALIFGGLAGYVLAILAYFLFGTGLMTALAVWSFGGIGILVLALAISRLSRSGRSVTAQV